jgi:Flp pilus assembly protein TadD
VRFSEELLRVNPNDAGEMAFIAVCLAKLERRDEAAQYVARALRLTPSSPDVLWKHAVVLTLAGDVRGAMAAASDAVAHGYSVELARRDDDVAALRELPEFQRLVAPRN